MMVTHRSKHVCTRFEQNNVIYVVEENLARYSPTTPINSTDLFLLVAVNERIHLDGVYFLFRRVQDILICIYLFMCLCIYVFMYLCVYYLFSVIYYLMIIEYIEY